MKRLFTSFIAVALCHIAFGQAQRLVLVEEFTQASCGPCASQNPGFNALLEDNADKVVAIKYHTSWPGVDEMYNHNTVDCNARVTYYNVSGVPHGLTNGVNIQNDCGAYVGAPACLDESEIDEAYDITSPLEISVAHSISADGDSVYVTMTITAVGSVSGTLVAQMVIIEKGVYFTSPPGTNGETYFPDVMVKMLPNASGTALPGTIDAGYTTTLTQAWKLANIYDLNQLAVVGFVQNNANKQVIQAGYSEPQQLVLDGAVTSLTSTFLNCATTITPEIQIKNTGIDLMTSCDIEYKVDNGTAATASWTGSLDGGATTTYALPAITSTEGSHSLSATLTNINGESDINVGNNTKANSFAIAGTPVLTPIEEGFVSTTFPPTGWLVASSDNDKWVRNTQVGGFQQSTNSTKYYFYAFAPGSIDDLIVRNFDLSSTSETSATLEFALAKAKYTGYVDELQVLLSTDCGENWDVIYEKTDNNGLNTATSTADWKPTSAAHWRQETIDISDYIGSSDVFVMFRAIAGYGNNLYVDDINIYYGSLTGINEVAPAGEINVYPNPANDFTTVQFSGNLPAGSHIELLNLIGQNVFNATAKSGSMQINTSNLEGGMYILRLVGANGNVVKQGKLNITH